MIYSELTRKAMVIAYEAHEGQVDKAGMPYVYHPIHVADGMPDEISTATALLHDVVEDTDWDFKRLREEGIPEEVLAPLKLLTRSRDEEYEDYIRRIAKNRVARLVKLADLEHNSDLSRLPCVSDKDRRRIEKYQRAMEYLKGVETGPRKHRIPIDPIHFAKQMQLHLQLWNKSVNRSRERQSIS